MFLTKMNKAEKYFENFSETGLPVFEMAAEFAKKRAQYHIAEGHIIAALFQIAPDWVSFRISQNGVMPEQILAVAEKEMQEIKPYTKGGLKIHPSAAIFFRRAMKFANTDGRTQIDCLDLITALVSRIESLTIEQKPFSPITVESFRKLKKLFDKK